MKKDKKLVFGIMVTGVCLIAALTSTIAWFNGASYLEVNGFQVSLHNKDISISDDGENFVDFLGISEDDYAPDFTPVSSAFSEDWILAKDEMPTFMNGYDTPAKAIMGAKEDTSRATMGFFSKEYYIKSNSDVYISLNPEKSIFKGDHEYNTQHYFDAKSNNPLFNGMTDDEIINELDNVCKSLRMSILVLNDQDLQPGHPDYYKDYKYYIIDPYKESNNPTYLGGLLDSNEDSYYDYIEGKEAIFGDLSNYDKIVYDDSLNEDTELVGKNTCFNARTKAEIQHVNIDKSLENGFEIKKENSISLEDAPSKMEIPISARSPKRFVVSLYLEGWDRDNTNLARYAGFTIEICFMITRTR